MLIVARRNARPLVTALHLLFGRDLVYHPECLSISSLSLKVLRGSEWQSTNTVNKEITPKKAVTYKMSKTNENPKKVTPYSRSWSFIQGSNYRASTEKKNWCFEQVEAHDRWSHMEVHNQILPPLPPPPLSLLTFSVSYFK